jgi:hypothetical protein
MRALKGVLVVSCAVLLACADLIGASFGNAALGVDGANEAGVDAVPDIADVGADEGSPLAFDPLSLPDLAFWIDATSGVDVALTDAASAPVTMWHDRSGNGHDAIPIGQGTNTPTLVPSSLNGLAVVHFDAAASDLLGAMWTGPGGTELSIFLVTRGYANSALRFQSMAGAFPFVILPLDVNGSEASPDFYFYVGTTQGATQTVTTLRTLMQSGVELITAQWAADGTATTFRDGVLIEQRVALNPSLPAGQALYIGGAMPGASALANGDIAEALVYATLLDDASRIQVEAYLREKWSI